MIRWVLVESPLAGRLAVAAAIGAIAGWLVALWADRFSRSIQSAPNASPLPGGSSAAASPTGGGGVVPPNSTRNLVATEPAALAADSSTPVSVAARIRCAAVLGLFFPVYLWLVTVAGCQDIPEQGQIDWLGWRLLVHFLLFSLLLAATVVDLRHYLIPDDIIVVGLATGLAAGLLCSHVHLVPAWVDWNQEHPLLGPYIPEWMKQSPHWHGLLVSMSGAIVGGGAIWAFRTLASLLLGREAMGFGDVTLMTMVGSLIGWQPALVVLLIGPLAGLTIGLLWQWTSGRTALPYGPFLALATVFVLCAWKAIWLQSRLIFGHLPTLAAIIGGAAGALVLLLLLRRIVLALPMR